MAEPLRQVLLQWRLEEALAEHPELRIEPPGRGGFLRLSGRIHFHRRAPDGPAIEDAYEVRIEVPERFPAELPAAYVLDGRIPPTHHRLRGGALCLGSPTALRMQLAFSPTLPTFIETILIPYLFSHSWLELYGIMPFGELDHGVAGLSEFLENVFGQAARGRAIEYLRLASLRKRHANKQPCPCGSGHRLGRCHHLRVNEQRSRFGRKWFRGEHRRAFCEWRELLDVELHRRSRQGSGSS